MFQESHSDSFAVTHVYFLRILHVNTAEHKIFLSCTEHCIWDTRQLGSHLMFKHG